ncbi:P-loop containing nucleoside triphosphate hydrolase protein [Mycena crocata]|nr:P-loop containing nucleoside triphosphate hydrolase protein [Mycena crocata]
MYMIVMLAVLKDPNLCPSAKFPKDPCLVIICPTIPLQLEMAEKMRSVGLNAIAINSNTREEAQRLRQEELWVTSRKEVNVIVAGPDQLKSDEFEKALRDDHFFNRSCGVGFDEVHLLNAWGRHFRKDFEQMGFVKARMSDKHNPWILTSATFRDGHPYDNVVKLLGLTPGQFHTIRRSNLRPDVQILFREFTSSLTGDSFPELDWILEQKRSTVIFPTTISLSSAIYIYLTAKCKPEERSTRVRMYNSMNFESHNAKTREYLNDPDINSHCQIVIGTDSLSVGVDMAARQDAIVVGEILDSDNAIQKEGRVGRNRQLVTDARLIVYVSKATRTAAEKAIKNRDDPTTPKMVPPLDLSMAEMILADCKVAAQNRLYNNPKSDPPCTCKTCTDNPPPPPRVPCNCSGCMPESLPPTVKPIPPPKPSASIPKGKRLTRLQKAHGTTRLLTLQRDLWRQADVSQRSFLPPEAFLPTTLIKKILDVYVTLDSLAALAIFLKGQTYLENCHHQILDFLRQLKPEFQKIAADRRAELAAARAAKKGVQPESDGEEDLDSESDSNSEEVVPSSSEEDIPAAQPEKKTRYI